MALALDSTTESNTHKAFPPFFSFLSGNYEAYHITWSVYVELYSRSNPPSTPPSTTKLCCRRIKVSPALIFAMSGSHSPLHFRCSPTFVTRTPQHTACTSIRINAWRVAMDGRIYICSVCGGGCLYSAVSCKCYTNRINHVPLSTASFFCSTSYTAACLPKCLSYYYFIWCLLGKIRYFPERYNFAVDLDPVTKISSLHCTSRQRTTITSRGQE